jgi:hypothetical protein
MKSAGFREPWQLEMLQRQYKSVWCRLKAVASSRCIATTKVLYYREQCMMREYRCVVPAV